MKVPALLLAFSAAFFLAFDLQRSRSGFLAVEARVEEARVQADEKGVPLTEVLALHELFGGALSAQQLDRQVELFAAQKQELGDELLAVLAVRGRRPLADRLRGLAGGDREQLHGLIRAHRGAVADAVRFASVAERYETRGHR